MASGGGDRTSIQDLKIQVRRKDGKIFGPYSRREVLGFIYAKKLDGSESILFDGTDRWRPLNSDNEFFDALQEVLFGVKPDPSRKAKSGGRSSQETVVGSGKTQVGDVTRVSTGGASSDVDLTNVSNASPRDSTQVGVSAKSAPAAPAAPNKPVATNHEPNMPSSEASQVRQAPGTFAGQPTPSPQASPLLSSKKSKNTLLLSVVLAGLVAWLVLPSGSKVPVDSSVLGGDPAQALAATPAYFRPLMIRYLSMAPLKVPTLPDNLKGVTDYTLPQGFGAHVFTDEIKRFVALPPEQRLGAESWMRFVWSTKWLGEILSVYSEPLGADLLTQSSALYTQLAKRTTLPPDFVRVYGQIENIARGKLELAYKELKVGTDEFSRWLCADVGWLRYWRGEITAENWLTDFSSEKFSSTALESSHQVKKLFLEKSPDTVFWLDQLAVEDPESYSLWFVSAEYFWRVQSAFLQKAYLFWVSGMGSVSLYPKAHQEVYLQQMSTLIKLFGRQDPANQLLANTKLLSEGNVFASKDKWHPILGPAIDVDQLTDEILDSGAAQRLAPIRLASLQNLSFTVSRRGGRKLLQVGYYWIFEKNYKRALETFDSATSFEDAKAEAWGAKVWLHAERFQFDKALEALSKVGSFSKGTNQNDLYEAILHYFARDYDFARGKFEQFLKTSPGSGLGHYFYARLLESIGKNVDCAKAAFLGGSNGVGELGFRSRLLFYRCRVLAGLQVSGALADLEKMYQSDPSNTAAVVEYIRALSAAQLSDRAVAIGREAVEKFPRSFELRLALGDAYAQAREYDKALAFYNHAMRFRPDSAEAFIKMGDLLQGQEHYEKAAENYRVAAQLNSEFPEVWLKAAHAFRKAGKKEEAIFAYTKELEARPSVMQNFLDVAEYLLELSSPQAVIDLFQKFQASFNDDPRVAVRLAQAYLGLQNFEKARERAAFAQNRLPTHAEPYRILGIVADMEGNHAAAKRYLSQYLKLLPQAEDADLIRKKLSQPPYSNE